MTIRFGTSDWRGVVSTEITFAGTLPPARAICVQFDLRNATESFLLSGYDESLRGDQIPEKCSDTGHETPVGFRFIGELINEDKILSDGEESTRLSIKGHYPAKDGVLASLPAKKAVAARGTSLTAP